MPSPSLELDQLLDTLARASRPGDRVPTVRELMGRFKVSQAVVQLALSGLKSKGLIDSQVGRGTFFTAGLEATGAHFSNTSNAGPKPSSVLLLRRSISIARGRVVVDGLQRRLSDEGHLVLEVSYTDADHARTVLKGLPGFDACMIQSSFETITVETLCALRQKTNVVVVDGLALVGTDVDAVGLEWGEPLAAAIERLEQLGHRRIAHATTERQFLANEMGLRRLAQLRTTKPGLQLHAISVPSLPQENYEALLAGAIKASMDSAGQLPFTALVAWGIEDGARFRAMLSDLGVGIPHDLSVVLLGRPDLANEHANFFDTIGGKASDQIEQLYQAITARWADPSRPYRVHLLAISGRAGESVAPPR